MATYIVHYSSMAEECIYWYFIGDMHSEKTPFRFRIPRDPGIC